MSVRCYYSSWARMLGLRGWVAEEPVHSPNRMTALVGKGVVPPVRVFLSHSRFGGSSRPEIRSSTIPIFHLLRFRSSSLMMTTSPLAKGVVWFMYFIRCRSLNPCKYSVVHLVHKVCLHLRRYLTLLHRSNSLRWCGSSSGSWFDLRNSSELAVSTDNCMSSST